MESEQYGPQLKAAIEKRAKEKAEKKELSKGEFVGYTFLMLVILGIATSIGYFVFRVSQSLFA